MRGATILILALASLPALAACSREARNLGPSLPQTAPTGNADPRIAAYQANLYQVAQGGRYFSWYGCSGCHDDGAPGAANLPENTGNKRGHGPDRSTGIKKGQSC